MTNEYTPDDEIKFSDEPYANEGEVTPLHMLAFAKYILIGVMIVFLLAGASELYLKGNGSYEVCKITLPSIATLVIGYYFGSTK